MSPLVEEFVENLDHEKNKEYEIRLRDSINLVMSQINLYNKWLFALIIVYYLITSSNLNEGISLGGIDIKDVKILNQATPALIAILYLFYLKVLFYRNELEHLIDKVFSKNYNIPWDVNSNFKLLKPIVRFTIPYRPIYELLNVKGLDKGCWVVFLKFIIIGLPIMFIQIIPVLLVVKGSIYNIHNNWDSDLGKVSVIISCWALVLCLVLFLIEISKPIFLNSTSRKTF